MLSQASILCRVTPRQLMAARSLRLTVRKMDDVKTPIQQWGWEYLLRQKALKRPISPHLQIYQPQLTWYLSGLHRISGCVMAGTLLFGGVGFALMPFDFTAFVEVVRGWNIPMPITAVFKWIIAFPIIFHTLNGIRFMAFDLAKGCEIKTVYKSGWLVFGVSCLLALAIVAKSCACNANKKN